jgi:predicted PurR-regulated permease PerM
MQNKTDLTVFKNILLVILILAAGFLAYKIQTVLILFFASFVIASAIDPLVSFLEKKISRKLAVLIVGLAGFALITLFLIPFLNILIKQAILFLEYLPQFWLKTEKLFTATAGQIKLYGIEGLLQKFGFPEWTNKIGQIGVLPDVSQVMAVLSSIGQNIISNSINLTGNFASGIMFSFLSALIILYMLIDKNHLNKRLLALFPQEAQNRVDQITGIISKKVGGFVISQLIMVFMIGFFTTIGFSLLGLNFSVILGTIAGICDVIPLAGPVIATVIIVVAALAQKPVLALWALVIYAVVQWILDTFLRPVILGKFLDLHPLTLIFSFLTGGLLLGIAGVVLAPAFAAAICVLIDELHIKQIRTDN